VTADELTLILTLLVMLLGLLGSVLPSLPSVPLIFFADLVVQHFCCAEIP